MLLLSTENRHVLTAQTGSYNCTNSSRTVQIQCVELRTRKDAIDLSQSGSTRERKVENKHEEQPYSLPSADAEAASDVAGWGSVVDERSASTRDG